MDQTLLRLINEKWTNSALDLFMAALSNSAIWMPILVTVAIAAVVFGGFRARACVVCILITLVIAEQITGVLKSVMKASRSLRNPSSKGSVAAAFTASTQATGAGRFFANAATPLRARSERTYSAPFATRAYQRETTERQEAIDAGTVTLAGNTGRGLEKTVERVMANERLKAKIIPRPNPYGDGGATERILKIVWKELCQP